VANYGLKITKDGEDVATAVDKNLVYSSKFNGMKIAKHNTAGIGSTAHGIAYVPTFLSYRKYSGTKYRVDSGIPNFDGTPYVTSTNIVFPNADNYYFIFLDSV